MANLRQPLFLAALGVASYAFFLFITLPMSLALDWSDKLPAEVSTYGIEGSIFDGSADTLVWQNWRLDRLQWQFSPLQLLSGRFGYQLRFTNPDGSGSGSTNAGVGLGGSTHLDQLALRLPLSWLSRQWSASTRFAGDLDITLAELTLEDGLITAAEGTLLWADARLRGSPPTPLGNFRALLLPVEQDGVSHYRGPISDNGGPLSASGEFELSTDGQWQIHGKLALREGSNSGGNRALAQLLASLGTAGADGKVDFSLRGQLPLPQGDVDENTAPAGAIQPDDPDADGAPGSRK